MCAEVTDTPDELTHAQQWRILLRKPGRVLVEYSFVTLCVICVRKADYSNKSIAATESRSVISVLAYFKLVEANERALRPAWLRPSPLLALIPQSAFRSHEQR